MRIPIIFGLWLALVAAPVLAQPRSEPVVLAVDGKDIYVDLGAKDGVGAGAQLELLHEVIATDPTSGKQLHDRFALGTLEVARSGDHTSIAHADAELAKRVLAGDHVRLVGDTHIFVDPWQAQVEASHPETTAAATTPGPALDHAALAREAWQATLGQPPEQRIARWQALLAADPQTGYRRAIETEIASLRAQIDARDAALAAARSSSRDRAARIAELSVALAQADPSVERAVIAAAAPATALPGRPLGMAFLVRAPDKVGRAFLYARTRGEVGFHRTELARDGDAYLRGTIATVQAPAVEWYVEVAPPHGEARPVLGSISEPRSIEVAESVVEPPPAPNRSHIDLHVDYVDFDGRLSKGYDQYYLAEGDFMYRFLDPIYSMRLGFGTLSGVGGPRDVIDHDPRGMCVDTTGVYRCKRVDFSYVYTELEFRLRPQVALMVRPQLGVLTTDSMAGDDAAHCQSRDPRGCQFLTGAGGRVRLRLGQEQATNLVLGASFSRGVGTLLEAAYHWLPAPVVPVQITVQVTDQPVLEDFGVRLIGDVGYRKLGWFYPSARVSYQARGLDHTGVSGGMAMNFDW
ncbi:MAG: hemophore-related protein [Kofleriaceae bacterium]